MIGIGTSISKGQVINDPSSISDLVVWYNFTDVSSLRKNRDGTTAVTTNNDVVHWAQNLANGDANGILGNFIRSEADGSQYGGIFKTGGINGQSYLQFAETDSDNSHGLRSGFIAADATDDGGVASDKFSDVSFNVSDLTIIQVLKHDDTVIEEDDNAFFIQGYPAVGGDTNSFQYAGSKSQSTEKFALGYVVSAGGIDFESNVTNDTLDASIHAMVMRSTPGANNMTLQVDGVVQTDTDTPDDRTMKFDRSTGVTTNLAGAALLSIGGNFTGGANLTKSWRGAIYETIIYSRFITDEELASLEVYFAGKYGITFS
tara:strand:+ start:1295 stop:2242 length:948 start_codon:yes stop_codon:yes gene_type:complete